MKFSKLFLSVTAAAAPLAFGLSIGTVRAQPTILLVSDNAYSGTGNVRTGDPEVEMEAFLEGLGYTVIRATGAGATAQFRNANEGAAGAAAVGADLIIVSRVTDSGQYINPAGWNSITTPLLLLGPHCARPSRWLWINSETIDQGAVTDLVFSDPNHPFVAGLGTGLFDSSTSLTRVGLTSPGNGTLIATTPDGDVALIEWSAGTEFYPGSGQTAGGRRVYFGGLRYHETEGAGGREYVFEDYSENGKAILAQIINNLAPVGPTAPPRILNLEPRPGAIGHDPADGISFNAVTDSPNTIAAGDIGMTVNGVDVTASLVISGSATDRAVSYTGLMGDAFYTAEITVRDNNARETTRSLAFDTLGDAGVIIESEDYNYALDGGGQPMISICAPGDPSPVGASGGGFQDNPPPSGFTPGFAQVNGGGVGYLDLFAQPDVDYSDTGTMLGSAAVNNYRTCTPVGVRTTGDFHRDKYIDLDIEAWDQELHQVQAGEWLNYTRTFPNANYKIYLRTSSTVAQQVTLSRVTSDRTVGNQTTSLMGHFDVPMSPAHQYVPLTAPGTDQALVLNLSGVLTLRMTALSSANNLFPNFLAFIPTTDPVTLTVTITSPTEGQTFAAGSDITINATVTGPGTTVNRVEFLANGVEFGEDTVAPYSAVFPDAQDGTYAIEVVATDSLDRSVSSSVNIVVGDVTPPMISITSPATGASFNVGDDVPITVSASDNRGVVLVEYFDGMTKIGESMTSPFGFTYPMPAAGRHSLTARAHDAAGNSATSGVARISVGTVPPFVLFIVGNAAALNASDAGVVARLQSFNMDVQVLSGSASVTGDALDKDMVIVSSTIPSGDVGTKFRGVSTPVLHWEQANQDDYLNTGNTDGTDRGTVAAQTTLNIVDAAHPLAAGLALGNHVVSGSDTYNYGVPNANASVVARLTNSADRAAIYAYDPGDILIDGSTPAPGRRVFTFMGDNTFALLNSAGLALFDAAVFYTLGSDPPQVAITSPGDGTFVPVGGSVMITASASSPEGISLVEFFVDGVKIGEDSTAPYNASFNNVPEGAHQLTARALSGSLLAALSPAVTVRADATPPSLLGPKARLGAGTDFTLVVRFSEPVGASALAQGNYQVSQGVMITGVSAGADSSTVVITGTGLTEGVIHALTVNNVQDLAGNSIDPNSTAGVIAVRQVITSVVEMGGDTDAPDAKFTGQTFDHPVLGAGYTVPRFEEESAMFTDRNHQWNGATPSIVLPWYLAGCEYIMSQNDNRDNDPYEMQVTVAVDAEVYLLIDDRLPDGVNTTPPGLGPTAMQWVLDQGWEPVQNGLNRFDDPSRPDHAGADEGGDGVGPGVGINQWSSVYFKRMPAGTFSLFQANNTGRNMYGVVVAPSAQIGPLSIARLANGDVQISWTGPGRLQEATSVLGPYTDVAGNPSSPFVVTPAPGTTKFYQLAL